MKLASRELGELRCLEHFYRWILAMVFAVIKGDTHAQCGSRYVLPALFR